MAENTSHQDALLRRPLYLFDLPQELLLSLTLRSDSRHPQTAPSRENSSQESTPPPEANDLAKSTSCTLCHADFPTVIEQREHVRSDFHRYNLKLKLKGLASVDEGRFTKLIGDLDESLSGSDSDDSDEWEEEGTKSNDTTLTALLKRQAKISQQNSDDDATGSKKKSGAGAAPLLWLSSSALPANVALGIYKAVLTNVELAEAPVHLVDTIHQKQLKPVQAKQSGSAKSNPNALSAESSPHVFLCMIGGGHFAAMIVGLAPEIRRGQGGVEERHAIVKAHKTFHRYTTRRKQGGSQSANDNAKGNAHSAGSSIRRYNEAALELDIRNVLSEWKSMIDTAELLFVRATGATNRRTLFGPYDNQVLRSNDPRLRGFPFSTRRATQAELMRSFSEVTRLKVSTLGEDSLQAASVERESSTKPSKTQSSPRPTTPKPSKEEETAALHTSQIQALIRRSKAPGLLIYLSKNSIPSEFTFFPPSQFHHTPTPLHLAASINSPAVILALVTKANANPTLRNGDGKTAFDIAGDTRTRDAFRVARGILGESVLGFSWEAAHVPTPLTQAEADARAQSDKANADAAEAERRKEDLQKIRQAEEEQKVGKMQKKGGAGKSLGVAAAAALEKTGAERREEEARGMTPEMRARLERERRARAAEERIRRMQQGN